MRRTLTAPLLVAALWAWPASAGAQPALATTPADSWLAKGLLAATLQPTVTAPAGASTGQPAAPSYADYFPALGYSFTHGLAAREQLVPLAIGSAAALVFLPFDLRVSDAVRTEHTVLNRAGAVAGNAITLGAVSGGLIAGSLTGDDARFRTYAFALSQGLIVAESLTAAVKLAIPRPRPDRTSRFSFPSAHAAGSFALAAVSSHYYGARAGVPLYALASLVALSRVTYGKHFPSDVVFGAAIGYISAKAAVRGADHVTPTPSGTSQPLPASGSVVFSVSF